MSARLLARRGDLAQPVTQPVTPPQNTFTPLSLSPLVWYDSAVALDASDAQITTDLTAVKTVTDRSGNSRHLTQAIADNRPFWVASGRNNQPVLRFDGVNDMLQSLVFSQGSPYTVFEVGVWRNPYSRDQAMSDNGAVNGLLRRVSSTGVSLYDGYELACPTTPELWHAYCAEFGQNGNPPKVLRIDNSNVSAQASNSFGLDRVTLGSTGSGVVYGAVDIGEYFAVAGIATSATRTQVADYFRSKWGTP